MDLRDTKVELLASLHSQLRRLQDVQEHLPPSLRHPLPSLPSLLPEETPEKKLRYTRATLRRYNALLKARHGRRHGGEEGEDDLLAELEMEGRDEEEEERGEEKSTKPTEVGGKEEQEPTEMEEEMRRLEEIRNLDLQDSLLREVRGVVFCVCVCMYICMSVSVYVSVYYVCVCVCSNLCTFWLG